MIPGIPQDSRSRKKISGHSDRLLAQNFDTVLDMVVKLAGKPSFEKFARGPKNTFYDTHKIDIRILVKKTGF